MPIDRFHLKPATMQGQQVTVIFEQDNLQPVAIIYNTKFPGFDKLMLESINRYYREPEPEIKALPAPQDLPID